ncbi:MAG: hypothetical protein IAI49_01755 [Candidatus Eremiobacteraeota bacterium]|nr:hypothetical protein [Candidatus Eremiobacteraeota bacterium]
MRSLADVLFAELARALYVEEPLQALTEDYDHAAAMQRALERRLRFTAAVISRRRHS